MKLKKIIKKVLLATPLLAIAPSTNLIKNNLNNNLNIRTNIEYNFTPIKNFSYVYDDEKINLEFNLKNKYESISYIFNPIKISIHDNVKSSINYMTNEISKKINDKNIHFLLNDLKNGDYKIEKNQYIPYLSNSNKQYNIKKSCGKNHSQMVLNCNKEHMHMRGCFKTIIFKCSGCIDAIEETHFEKIYNLIDFNKYLRTNFIIKNDFDFSNLLQIDYSNSYKSFDKNILSFSINKQYLESIILGSFNYAYATKFFYENTYIKNEIKHLLSSAIYLNKLTIFDHEIPKFFGYINKNFDKKHNLRYWIENTENLDYIELKKELNNLEVLPFSNYLNKQNINIDNPYIGKILFDLFSNENKLKNINFNINYYLGNNQELKTFSSSIYNLILSKNNKIIYEFKNELNSHQFNNQKISIVGNSISSSNNDLIYIEKHNLGVSQKDANNIDVVNKINEENKIIYNEELNFSNLIKIKDNLNFESYLKNNNIFGKASSNINENTFRILTKFNESISFKNNLLENNIPKEVDSLQHTFFKKYINNYKLIPNDLLGSMDIFIYFNDQSNIKFRIYGFEKINEKNFEILKNDIKLSELNINDINNINNQYIEDNLISYLDDIKNKSIFKISLEKDFFIENINYSIKRNIDKNKNMNIILNVKLNSKNLMLETKIINDLKENQINKKIILIPIISFFIIMFILSIFSTIYISIKFKKYKKNNII